jgi:hypothetical protein
MSHHLSKSRICEVVHECPPWQVGRIAVLGANKGNWLETLVACI